ncbi:hypothetical protein A0J61_10918 [Choanephora cucurbitarum]|uniref:C2H2-type domain-containing protein n=1 Tax=Choanephora cucurbitarum TaxID=101091 RepID=A0A1C7N107_9FUNG|nr:hypothetical protein A0J61_10918 [Choanephora cucurbitarum]
MSSIFRCLFCQAVFLSQKALTEHIISTNCAYYANLNVVQSALDNNTTSSNESVSLNEFETETGVADDTNNADLTDVSMSVGSEGEQSIVFDDTNNADLNEPVIYDWVPSEPLNVFKSTWISIMQLLDEAKTPRHYQRQLIHVLNNNLLSHVAEA